MHSPLVINTPNFSTDVSGIEKCEVWAALSTTRAVLIDECGNYDGPARLHALAWTEGFVDYARDWVANRDGVGANAITWCWYDGNTMVGYENGSAQDGRACDGELTPWGAYFRTNYLDASRDGGL